MYHIIKQRSSSYPRRFTLQTWMSSGFTFLALLCCSFPPMFFTHSAARYIWVSISVTLLTLLAVALHYIIVTSPIRRLADHIEQLKTQCSGEAPLENTISLPADLSPSQEGEVLHDRLLSVMSTASACGDIYAIQRTLRTLVRKYLAACTCNRVLRESLMMGTGGRGTGGELQSNGRGRLTPVDLARRRTSSASPEAKGNEWRTPSASPDIGNTNDAMTEDDLHSCGSLPPWPLDAMGALYQLVDDVSLAPVMSSSVDERRVLNRGNRFPGDNSNICLYIERSKNSNIVVYEGQLDPSKSSRDTPVLLSSKPIRGYWLDLDPEYVAKARAKGKMDDVEHLNIVEKKLAYGFRCSVTAAGPQEKEAYSVHFVALEDRVLRLTIDQVPVRTGPKRCSGVAVHHPSSEESDAHPHELRTIPVLEGVIGGIPAIVERIYVASTEPKHFWNLPKVEYVDISGYSLASGSLITERIQVKSSS